MKTVVSIDPALYGGGGGGICKVLYVCANHFKMDCLKNEGHFNAGFSQKLILKGGSIPTLHVRMSAPDKACPILFSKASLKELLGTL